MIIGAIIASIYLAPFNPLVWILVVITFNVWQEQGGFIGWKSANSKKFLAKAKKLGL